jgi:FdrA protein
MEVTRNEIRAGAYYDSVVLMQLQRALADLPGVIDAGVVMATPANCELLEAGGLSADRDAGSDDLLIVVKAEDESSVEAALGQVDELLSRRRSGQVQAFRPRSLEAAVKQLPEANWVLISVPGQYAASVSREALRLGKHVFLFSDNVSMADELALKSEGRDKGLLVMGPDCGTAIINGVGLGFANRVRRGSIGIVGASGTGMQAISSAIHNLGEGISQAIGTGGRDLKQEIGAITTRQGLAQLAGDPDTKVIVLVSKPPEKSVAAELLTMAAACGKPVVVDFVGYSPPARQMGLLRFASSLTDAAQLAVRLAASENTTSSDGPPAGNEGDAGFLRGLFSGGTLAYEAMLGLQAFLQPLYSNVPIVEEQRLSDPLRSRENTVLDLGEDDFTQGRLHPMMDNDLRLRRMAQEAADVNVSLIMLDIVLGEGAHPDPASEIGPAVERALDGARMAGRSLDFAVIVIGSDVDAQQLEAQIARMVEAGAVVFQDTILAVNYARTKLASKVTEPGQPLVSGSFQGSLSAINVGLETFYDSLVAQGSAAVQVEWRPPAGGNEKLLAVLEKMRA